MSRINSICVYCASGPGTNPAFVEAARGLGRILAENDIKLVYGGGSIGFIEVIEDWRAEGNLTGLELTT